MQAVVLAGLDLVAHVDLAGRIVADEHHGQAGLLSAGGEGGGAGGDSARRVLERAVPSISWAVMVSRSRVASEAKRTRLHKVRTRCESASARPRGVGRAARSASEAVRSGQAPAGHRARAGPARNRRFPESLKLYCFEASDCFGWLRQPQGAACRGSRAVTQTTRPPVKEAPCRHARAGLLRARLPATCRRGRNA